MIFCIDSGNTRIKWGMHDGRAWVGQGVCRQGRAADLSELVVAWPEPSRILLSNVAGPNAQAAILQALGAWGKAVTVMRATACAGGVVNGYRQPETLGVDRWCALVGARRRLGRAAVVVGAGTATTVDLLDGHGRFLGGLILPGLELMRESLARGTAGLARASGQVVRLPDNTADAIASGAVEATAGAVERASRRLGDAPCLLFGGAAAPLKAALTLEVIEEPLLVLEGLHVLAADSA
ncbi:MAG: type III pantothenate kinase [Azonexus sp.]|nr:type III pantothenate kinase [Betaproteobacteria bacterium]MBK8916655.1 type III pantothenate kinase [Betaproteobacteria bacterium]MBP6037225.1 type III pantothenate kinase [Azonexus sp.]MBP6907739.1 type III pantothenate kinase [Azonexus sp.]